MKKLLLGVFVLLMAAPAMNAQDFADIDKSPMDITIIRNHNMKPPEVARVIYSRPKKRGRDIFGSLVPFEKVWRTGANEATELTLYKDMQIGGQTVPAGSYSLFTIPEKNHWTIILNRTAHQWGAYTYDEDKDLLRIQAPARTASNTIEDFSMAFQPSDDGTNLFIGWDKTYVKVPFKYTEDEMMKMKENKKKKMMQDEVEGKN